MNPEERATQGWSTADAAQDNLEEARNQQGPVEDTGVIPRLDELAPGVIDGIGRLSDEYGQLGVVKAVFAIYPTTVRDVTRWIDEETVRRAFARNAGRPGSILRVSPPERDGLGPWDTAVIGLIAVLIGFIVWVIAG